MAFGVFVSEAVGKSEMTEAPLDARYGAFVYHPDICVQGYLIFLLFQEPDSRIVPQGVETPKPTTLIGLSEISEISGAICHGAPLA